MGVGQIYYFILIPENDKNPSPPPFPQKRPGSYWFSTFYGPKTYANYETAYHLSTAFALFFRFISRPETLAPITSSRGLRTVPALEQRGPERFSPVPDHDPGPDGFLIRNLRLAPGNTPSVTPTGSAKGRAAWGIAYPRSGCISPHCPQQSYKLDARRILWHC
jgi:hypothetical protein